MNILPIPGLDGGHAIFTFWEMITGRKVSDKILEGAHTWDCLSSCFCCCTPTATTYTGFS